MNIVIYVWRTFVYTRHILEQGDIMNKMCRCADAISKIKGENETKDLRGEVKFYQKKGYVLILTEIKGLPSTDSGFFGFHIHEGCDCGGMNFANTGNHYNPSKSYHPSHAGDLPPLLLCNEGAYQVVVTDRFSVADIIGRTVVIHSMPDNFNSQPSGNAGTKIACGKIHKL